MTELLLIERSSAYSLEGGVDQRLHSFNEQVRVGQAGVDLECGLICPAGVDVEQT